MCMKNVNATMFMCSEIRTDENQINSLIGIYDGVTLFKNDGEYRINKLNIALNCSIIFDKQFENSENCVQLGTAYEFMILLTHVESGQSVTLHKFTMVIDNENLKLGGKNFFEFKRFLMCPPIELPQGTGEYALKLLIKKSNEDIWNTQTIQSLTVNSAF